MTVTSLLMTTTSATSPLDGSGGADTERRVSDFLTLQSLANFAVMTGAITAAWNALQRVWPQASALWVPYILAFVWATISLLISWKGLQGDSAGKPNAGTLLAAGFVALINALVLAGAVVGTSIVTGKAP